jgi:hypothetical protein
MVYVQGAPLSGINSLTPVFLIHSKYPISTFNANSTDGKYGIFDKLSVLVNGSNLFKAGSDQYEFTSVSATSIKIQIKNGLAWGGKYNLSIQSSGLQVNQNNASKVVGSVDMPSTMTIHTKF